MSDPLASIRAFARGLLRAPWFAACGAALGATERGEAEAYLAALGFSGVAIAGVGTWSEAAAITQRADWSRAWWEAEAAAQQELTRRAAAALGETPLLQALSAVTEAAASLDRAAALAMRRAGIDDAALARVAAGAAAQACHQQALALAAAAGPTHLLAVKYRLFAGGRWPLGVVGGCCFVF